MQHSNDERGEEDNRLIIYPYGDSFMDATYVVRQLNKIVNNYWRGPWNSYSSTPKQVKDLWWNEFKRKFNWNEMEEDEVRRIFKKKAGDHIQNVMNKAKRSQGKPDFITGDDWTEIKRIWESEKNMQRSEQNKKNRASSSLEGSATYAGGSINIGEHKKRMANELGTEPTYIATFERTFEKKVKTWISDQAKAIKEKYDELLMSTAIGGDGGAESELVVDHMALWVEASGGMKRGKIFGMGSLSRVYTTKVTTSSSSGAAISRRTQLDEQVTQELTQLRHLLVEKDEEIRVVKEQMSHKDEEMRVVKEQMSQKDEEMRVVNERHKSLESQMQLVLRHLNLNPDEVPPVPPTNQIGDGHNDDQ
ncbi:uncharacterized protein LOC125312741 [Rhodamnia argentea]|uniref:Uncharacterized protein LOC125312741 n=1 Tax=Rhodamnia argentea TaxID=178133 RepID=A0ABM3GTZ3_9MYRT|nr:uncharacterized protein LOC125312741 [Rhodamnia argentea]